MVGTTQEVRSRLGSPLMGHTRENDVEQNDESDFVWLYLKQPNKNSTEPIAIIGIL